MRTHWKTIVIAVVVATIGLSVVAVAYGGTKTTKRKGTLAGACAQLLKNPDAVKDMQALRAEHQKEMQDWYTTYGSDTSGTAAQAALKALRTEHWNDMKALFEKYGVTVPANAGPGAFGGGGMMGGGGGCGGGGCGGTGQGGNAGAGYGMMGGGSGMMGGYTY